MATREILVAGAPVLRKKAKRITHFGSSSLEDLVEDMLDSMRAVNGLGLAAPQIGVPLRVIVIEVPEEKDEDGDVIAPSELHVYCNPELVKASGEEEDDESCLSVPGYVGTVKRSTHVTVKGQDVKGHRIRSKAEGLLARAFQHEIDHLNGVLYIDRAESPEKLRHIESGEDPERLGSI